MAGQVARRISWVATTVAVAATAATAAAPTGSTAISGFQSIWVGTDTGAAADHIYVGVRYIVHADAIGGTTRVNFYDNDACLGSTLGTNSPYSPAFEGNYAQVYWVPTTTGAHLLTTKQNGWEPATVTFQVEATPTDTTPVAQPKLDACGGGGGLPSSGSSGL